MFSYFKEDVTIRVCGQTTGEAEMRLTPRGKNVTSCRVRAMGEWGQRFVELVAWDEGAVIMNKALVERGLRVVAVGIPMEEIYNGKVQHKVTVKELWVEDAEGLKEWISKNGVVEEEEPKRPLQMPEAISF